MKIYDKDWAKGKLYAKICLARKAGEFAREIDCDCTLSINIKI